MCSGVVHHVCFCLDAILFRIDEGPLEFDGDLGAGWGVVLQDSVTVELVTLIVGRRIRAADKALQLF